MCVARTRHPLSGASGARSASFICRYRGGRFGPNGALARSVPVFGHPGQRADGQADHRDPAAVQNSHQVGVGTMAKPPMMKPMTMTVTAAHETGRPWNDCVFQGHGVPGR